MNRKLVKQAITCIEEGFDWGDSEDGVIFWDNITKKLYKIMEKK